MKHQHTNESVDLLRLQEFEEICGRLQCLSEDDNYIYVHLSTGKLRFPLASPEAAQVNDKLDEMEGERVGILRTPNIEQPIRIRYLSN